MMMFPIIFIIIDSSIIIVRGVGRLTYLCGVIGDHLISAMEVIKDLRYSAAQKSSLLANISADGGAI